MKLTGETIIDAPRRQVWDALNDPAILERCIEGCESLERSGSDSFEGAVNAKIGPVRAKFQGRVTISDANPPESYVLIGEGSGGAAGFVKGRALVRLEETESGNATRLRYEAEPSVGGKLAQVGGRLIEGTAKTYSEKFFACLKSEVERPGKSPAEAVAASPATVEADAAALAAAVTTATTPGTRPVDPIAPTTTPAADVSRAGLPPIVWGGIIALLVLILIGFLLA